MVCRAGLAASNVEMKTGTHFLSISNKHLIFGQDLSRLNMSTKTIETFGEKIRRLREQADMPLRKLSALLDIDQSTLSKIERGERSIKKDQILVLADILKVDQRELVTLWLTDQVYELVNNEGENAINVLEITKTRLKNRK